jgi:glycosyltransferase involved in cell wall biosynthesis
MKKKPLITIGIATYNRRHYLERAVQSALVQDYPNVEIVICDDASTDETWEYLQTLSDERVRIFRNSTNLGASANHQQVLQHSRGTFIQFLQNDDELHKNALSYLVDYLQQYPAVAGVIGCSEYIDGDSQTAGYSPCVHRPVLVKGTDLLNRMSHHINEVGTQTNVLLRKSSVFAAGGFNINIVYAYDIELWSRICTVGDWIFVPDVLYRRRMGFEGTLSFELHDWKKSLRMARELLLVAEESGKYISQEHVRRWKIHLGSRYLMLGLIYLIRKKNPAFLTILILEYDQQGLLPGILRRFVTSQVPYQARTFFYKRYTGKKHNIRSGQIRDLKGSIVSLQKQEVRGIISP